MTLLFALSGSERLAEAADASGVALAPCEERDFAGGEHKARPLVPVRGEDVYVLHCLDARMGQSVNDRLVRLLFFIATCRDHGAARVTAIVPLLPYARKDRRTKPHDPLGARYVAQMFEAVGTDMLVTVSAHNLAAFQNAFRCGALNLDTHRLFASEIARGGKEPLAVVSPDPGGVKRAQLLRERLEDATGTDVAFGMLEKRRSAGRVSGALFAGEVEGRRAIIVDDMIVGGGTMVRAAEACRENGAASVHAYGTHALFAEGAAERLAAAPIDRVVVTDTAGAPAPPDGVEVLPVGGLIGEALTRLRLEQDLSDLLTL